MRRIPLGPRIGSLACVVLAVVASPAGGQAQGAAASEDDGFRLGTSGYVHGLLGLSRRGYEVPGIDDGAVIAAEVSRLKWLLFLGDATVLEAHQRLQTVITTSAGGPVGGSGGFGVSAVPERSVDLETTLVNREHVAMRHDIDRLSLTRYGGAIDLTLGRQAITWGISSLFPVADLWTRFSPFELDTEEKPGVDALRILAYPVKGLEVDGVIADAGTLDDLGVGVRATLVLPDADVYAGLAKFWRKVLLLAGGAWVLEDVSLRAEVAAPWALSGDSLQLPRVTLGADWIRSDLIVSGEIHYNGLGAEDAEGYDELLASPEFLRGESYFLGRWYVGALVSYQRSERLSFSLTAVVNANDPAALLTPVFAYDLGQSARITAGVLAGLGETPGETMLGSGSLAGTLIPSEFGAYADLWFTRVSVYF